ncbi:hypothetical protein GCM10017083_43760 [Thalassobaculum fulvum]|uniref:histidine kinase n=1 Tax=Thalassobaculum fulvum TaxID=1633335 RepID=A0A918XVG2_9PROT|nr:MHYT domain-containing protein [Thalassobaculum fulvum]GHD59491.1 hypothetical protein GCM10017083_43760 [Thalassobaculum fulvum]
MLRLYDCIVEQHDTGLVLLAGLVCVLACYTAVSLIARTRRLTGPPRLAWLGSAALVTGGGIWSTHFIAMLAFAAAVPVGYDLPLTVASVAIAVAMSGLGLLAAIVGGAPVVGGAIVGIGIATMHYTGMAALEVPAVRHWDPAYVIGSIAVGLLGASAAIAGLVRGRLGRPGAAGLLAMAICGLHFTGMAAFSLQADPRIALPERVMAPDWLAVAVAVVTVLIVGFALVGAMVDERLAERAAAEAERLRRHVAELEATKRDLEATTGQLQVALEAAAAGNQAKSQFLAVMSHELRTPLNAVIGFSEMMLREIYGPLGDRRYAGFAETIASSGQHLLGLIDDVLDFSGLDAGRLQLHEDEVDVGALLAGSVRMLERQAETAGVRVEADVPGDLPAVLADPQRLRQVALNLVSNAIKFTPTGGTVTVSASHGAETGMTITIGDTGIGIAAEDIPRALEQFAQVDNRFSRRFEGTGLGLPLSKRLVELHGGALSIESTVGAGTVVTVTLPRERLRPRATAA